MSIMSRAESEKEGQRRDMWGGWGRRTIERIWRDAEPVATQI